MAIEIRSFLLICLLNSFEKPKNRRNCGSSRELITWNPIAWRAASMRRPFRNSMRPRFLKKPIPAKQYFLIRVLALKFHPTFKSSCGGEALIKAQTGRRGSSPHRIREVRCLEARTPQSDGCDKDAPAWTPTKANKMMEGMAKVK